LEVVEVAARLLHILQITGLEDPEAAAVEMICQLVLRQIHQHQHL
jgi:hypothetical protein